MGDISAEPSMEDILSSIKRIIAEESDPPRARRGIGSTRAATRSDVLELSDPIEDGVDMTEAASAVPSAPPQPQSEPAAEPVHAAPPPAPPPPPQPAPAATTPPAPAPAPTPAPAPAPALSSKDSTKVSAATVEAARGALDSLSRMVVKPDQPGADTLEGLVREMLRPMLAQWLDAHLPALVEQMVAREIARITAAEL